MANNLGKWRNIDRKNIREVKQSAIIEIGTLQGLFGSGGLPAALISSDTPNMLTTGSDFRLKVDPQSISNSIQGVIDSSLNQVIPPIQQAITDANSAIQDNKSAITVLKGRVDGHDTDIVANTANIASNGSAITALTQRADAMDTTTAGLQTQIDAVPGLIDAHNLDATAHANQFDPITELIPGQASVSNQLADKDFVTDAIENMASNYITATAAGDELFAGFDALQAGPWYFRGQTHTPTNNDFAMVTLTNGELWRAIYDGTQWNLYYRVNESPFTSTQLAAINSGVTTSDVAQISTNQSAIAALNTNDSAQDTALNNLKNFKASALGDPYGTIPALNSEKLNNRPDTDFADAVHNHDATSVFTSGITPVQYGGTGLGSQIAGNMRYALNTTTSIMIQPPPANDKTVMTHSGSILTPPLWQTPSDAMGDVFAPIDHNHNASTVFTTGVVPPQYGGTGVGAQVLGNMRYATSTTTSAMIQPPTPNVTQVLTHAGQLTTTPVWQDLGTAGAGSFVVKTGVSADTSQSITSSLEVAGDEISCKDLVSNTIHTTRSDLTSEIKGTLNLTTISTAANQTLNISPSGDLVVSTAANRHVTVAQDLMVNGVVTCNDPVNATDAATKGYVDSKISKMFQKNYTFDQIGVIAGDSGTWTSTSTTSTFNLYLGTGDVNNPIAADLAAWANGRDYFVKLAVAYLQDDRWPNGTRIGFSISQGSYSFGSDPNFNVGMIQTSTQSIPFEVACDFDSSHFPSGEIYSRFVIPVNVFGGMSGNWDPDHNSVEIGVWAIAAG